MTPYQGGGDMIGSVTFERTTYAPIPAKFEAGTPNIADVIAFAAAIDYLEDLGMDAVRAHEKEITAYALQALSKALHVPVTGIWGLDIARRELGVLGERAVLAITY